MFNIGIVAARKPQRLVALSNHYLGAIPGGERRVSFWGDGRVGVSQDGTYDFLFVPGQWHINSPAAGLNVGWQIRATHQAGNVPDAGTLNSWANITFAVAPNNGSNWRWVNPALGGRILIEIRDTATQTIQASGRFWTAGYAP